MKLKIMMVCLGNICRSPLAKAVMQHHLNQLNLSNNIEVDASGTSSYHIGSNPDPRTIQSAHRNSIKLSHKAQQLKEKHFHEFDYILVMDEENLLNAKRIQPQNSKAKMHLIGEWFSSKEKNNYIPEVPDPYFGGEEGFNVVYEMLDDCCRNFIKQIQQNKL